MKQKYGMGLPSLSAFVYGIIGSKVGDWEMQSQKIAVCDDEKASLSIIHNYLKKNFARYDIAAAINPFQSAALFAKDMEEHSYDIYFVDIDMPEMNGIHLAQQIRRKYPSSVIVFVSAKEESVFQSFCVHPFSFVRKNCFQEDMEKTVHDIAHLLQKKDSQNRCCQIVDSAGYEHAFYLDSICYLEAQEKYVRVVLTDHEKLLRCSLKNLEKDLAPYDMVRCHKSYIVNMKKVYVVKHDRIVMTDKTELPIRRGMVSDLKKHLCRLLVQ